MFLFRLIALPVKLAFALVGVAFKLGLWAGKLPLRVTAGTAKVVGFKGTILFGGGVAAGLMLAPGPGSELRRRLQGAVTGGAVTDEDLAEKVAFELGHAPRTWHLPQPIVTVVGGRATLTGEVPHDEGRSELVRVASGVPGITAVVDELVVVDLAQLEAVAEELEELEELAAIEELAEEIAEEIVDEIIEELVEEALEELVEEALDELAVEALEEAIEEAFEAEAEADGESGDKA